MDFQHWFGGQEASRPCEPCKLVTPSIWGRLLLVLCGSFTFSAWSALAESLGTLSGTAHPPESASPGLCFKNSCLAGIGVLTSTSLSIRGPSALPGVDSFLLCWDTSPGPCWDNSSLRHHLVPCLVFNGMGTDGSHSVSLAIVELYISQTGYIRLLSAPAHPAKTFCFLCSICLFKELLGLSGNALR